MNHRERILAAINHRPLDRVPTDMWATEEMWQKLFGVYGVESRAALYDRMDIDGILPVVPPYIGPRLRDEGEYYENEWGEVYRRMSYGVGIYNERVVFPLANAQTIDDLAAHRWPDPDWYDYDALPALAAGCEGRVVKCGYNAPFYFHNRLRGLQLSLLDPLLQPEFTHDLIGRLSDFFTEYHSRCFAVLKGKVDITEVTDDFGSQHGLLISPKVFAEFYQPAMQRGIDLAHEHCILVFHHDDGDCRPLLPTLTEMGVHVLNPIQWRSGDWDLVDLKARFGKGLCFHGAVDNQQTLPFGSAEDVRAEVKHLIRTLAVDGTGYIVAPCHNLQNITPLKNIVALYEAAHEYGRLG